MIIEHTPFPACGEGRDGVSRTSPIDRQFFADSLLAERLNVDAELHEAPLKAYYGGDARGYSDFPTMKEA
ncbi:MAG: hypothetical protein MK186_02035 [Henriciella sp.]|nr:hypothetical protein [Henriciella sp.]